MFDRVSIRKEYVRCGKSGCELSHGPYYYAYWKEKVGSNDDTTAVTWKLKKKYIGSYLLKNDEVTVSYPSQSRYYD